ncbi:MAG: hypothetical protein ACFKPT_25070 [Gloeotrichia echinulata GP01]
MKIHNKDEINFFDCHPAEMLMVLFFEDGNRKNMDKLRRLRWCDRTYEQSRPCLLAGTALFCV